jgi:hypothetical protein
MIFRRIVQMWMSYPEKPGVMAMEAKIAFMCELVEP